MTGSQGQSEDQAGGGSSTSLAETFEQTPHDSSNIYDRFYRGTERDLRSDSPTLQLFGALKRAFLRTIYAVVLAVAAGVLSALLAYAYFSSLETAATAFMGMATACAPLVWAFGWHGWLPDKEQESDTETEPSQDTEREEEQEEEDQVSEDGDPEIAEEDLQAEEAD